MYPQAVLRPARPPLGFKKGRIATFCVWGPPSPHSKWLPTRKCDHTAKELAERSEASNYLTKIVKMSRQGGGDGDRSDRDGGEMKRK